MATRSAIGIKHGDRIKAVYCHWDGYLEHNGFILNHFYNDSVAVNKLISMGDISALGADIGEKHDFTADTEYVDIPNCITSVGSQCTFYNRDRGELTFFKSFDSEEEFVNHYRECGAEFFYLYDGEWLVKYRSTEFDPLAKLINKETA